MLYCNTIILSYYLCICILMTHTHISSVSQLNLRRATTCEEQPLLGFPLGGCSSQVRLYLKIRLEMEMKSAIFSILSIPVNKTWHKTQERRNKSMVCNILQTSTRFGMVISLGFSPMLVRVLLRVKEPIEYHKIYHRIRTAQRQSPVVYKSIFGWFWVWNREGPSRPNKVQTKQKNQHANDERHLHKPSKTYLHFFPMNQKGSMLL